MRRRWAARLGLAVLVVLLGLVYSPSARAEWEDPFVTPYPLEGTITDETGAPVGGVTLTAVSPYILYHSGQRELGSATTDANGHYRMEPFLRFFNDQNGIGSYITFQLKGYPVIRYLGGRTQFDFQFPSTLGRAEGKITIEGTELPNPGLPVQVGMRMNKGEIYRLGTGVTDDQGRYAISYIPADFTTYDERGAVVVSEYTQNNRFYDATSALPAAPETVYGYVASSYGFPLKASIKSGGRLYSTDERGGFAIRQGDTSLHPYKFTADGYVPYETTLGPGGPQVINLEFINVPPTVTANTDRNPDRNGWYNRDVTVTFEAQDSNPYQTVTVDPPKTVTTEGKDQLITGSATDEGGLTGSGSISISLDKTPPATKAFLGPVTSGSWRSTATMTLTAEDSLSGVDTTEYSLDNGQTWTAYKMPVNLDKEGSYAVLYLSLDIAGNQEVPKTLAVQLDRTAPVIQVTAPLKERYRDSADLVISYKAEDGLSGIDPAKTAATLDGKQVANGTSLALYTLPLGTHTFKVTAVDQAGNEAVLEYTFETFADGTSLKALFNRFAGDGKIKAPIANTLSKKLEDNQLKPFLSLLKAQRGKAVEAIAADYLERDAKALMGAD
ncbi:carboxypeptidase-like regulatory domain-containing protein [Paenibacillus aurantius]|uniref:Carboxypeptidase-like regulatory domain-containing protein n=1 Tax=Paenibacillus aurantius TaxID=2918900 RepID=A0AA96LEL6_9BACL|nr:carboxypeptidase-like regulatory domain-containing protein [Paenibacillus aurantius]WNQ11813.1 carboxypeptidase-like regulatory domain-containing protein [Paenibacillus aurantius]